MKKNTFRGEGWAHLRPEIAARFTLPEPHAHNFVWNIRGKQGEGVSIHWHDGGFRPHEHSDKGIQYFLQQ